MTKVLDENGLRHLVKKLKAELDKKKYVRQREDRILMSRGIAIKSCEDTRYRNMYLSKWPTIRIPSEYAFHKISIYVNGKRLNARNIFAIQDRGFSYGTINPELSTDSYIQFKTTSWGQSLKMGSYKEDDDYALYWVDHLMTTDDELKIFLVKNEIKQDSRMISFNEKMIFMGGTKKSIAMPRYTLINRDIGRPNLGERVSTKDEIYRWKTTTANREHGIPRLKLHRRWCHLNRNNYNSILIVPKIKIVRKYKKKNSIRGVILYTQYKYSCYITKAVEF